MNNRRNTLVYLLISISLFFGFITNGYFRHEIKQLKNTKMELIDHNLNSYLAIIDYQTELALKVEKIVEKEIVKKEYEEKVSTINSFLDGVLKNKAKVFIKAANQYELDPYLLIAISIHETGYGKSKIAVNKNNVCGCMTTNGAMSFNSVEDSIYYMAKNLRNNYFNLGLSSIEEIQQKYAPINATNDQQGLNHYWTYNVNNIYEILISNL